MIYSFLDSLRLSRSREANETLIRSLRFDTVIVKGKQQEFTIEGRPGVFIIFKLVTLDKRYISNYTQRIETFRIEPLTCTHDLNNEETRRWVRTVYGEQRRHFFDVPCGINRTFRK